MADSGTRSARRYRIRGLVQGVGFRPFVWRLATEERVTGFVLNDGDGVLIEAYGPVVALDRVERRLRSEAPTLSRVDAVESRLIDGVAPRDFSIRDSQEGKVSTGIVADAATCGACLAEVLEPGGRRTGYAFTNCTHCGPRLTIVHGIPYDRANTSMAAFAMCRACAREYADPADRRFHAEPIACPDCGPVLWFEPGGGSAATGDPIAAAAAVLARGGIVSVKGLGGFHLACDASSEAAVARLRARKKRYAKPLAVMVRDLDMARRIAHVGPAEATLLARSSAPIVLAERRGDGLRLASSIAPGVRRIGLMLPSTPLHHLLLRQAGGPLVMTSGNLSSEPQCVANDEARRRLAAVADAYLMHDRDIVNRLDDSVVRADLGGPTILRRARGYAPEPVALGDGFAEAPVVLALGGDLKSAFCFLRNGAVTLSPHIGDLDEARTRDDFRTTLDLYRRLYGLTPDILALDLHPNYGSTIIGEAMADGTGMRLERIQHHHAHLAACLAENGIALDESEAQPTLGIVLDGTGLGPDGTLWGGELLLGGYGRFERVGHLAPVALPGGDRAVREPWRNTVTHLVRAFGADWRAAVEGLAMADTLRGKPLRSLEQMIGHGAGTPLTSSTGRLFDAVAGALGLHADRQAYEGQTGSALEALAETLTDTQAGYPFALAERRGRVIVEPAPLWRALVGDLRAGVAVEAMAARFHNGLIDALATAAVSIATRRGVRRVALSGGVFANAILLHGLARRLDAAGLDVLTHHKLPANDGGLAAGQACIAATRAILRRRRRAIR